MKKRGFIHIIIMTVVGVVILAILGFDPVSVWENIVLPIIQGIWNIFLLLITFIVKIVSKLMGK